VSCTFSPGPVLKLDLPTYAMAGITGMCHHTWPLLCFLKLNITQEKKKKERKQKKEKGLNGFLFSVFLFI
jgi:hypothetical protein